MIGLLAARWFKSREIMSPRAKAVGAMTLLVFFPALLALLPWTLRWRHAVPIEGLLGRIVGDVLLHYLNLAGAYIVCGAVIGAALYLCTAFSFAALHTWLETRFAFVFAARHKTLMPKIAGGFKLPPSSLLHRADDQHAVNEEELKVRAQVLTEKCAEFDVTGSITQINPGPVVTTYEFKPEAGVKYSRITSLVDDHCLAMRAESILIERMAGKSTVGVQVPNHQRETIWLREVVESPEFIGTKSKLTL